MSPNAWILTVVRFRGELQTSRGWRRTRSPSGRIRPTPCRDAENVIASSIMRTARPLLRRLAAILRVVALLVMVPAFAQAHAGHDHAGRAESMHVHDLVPNAAALRIDLTSVDRAAETQGDRADCLACQGCCCAHVFVAASDGDGVRSDRPNGRRVAMGRDRARPSAVAEALPEPPRPVA